MLPSLFLSQGGPKTHPGCLPHFPAFPMAGPLLPSPSGPDQALPSPARHLSQPALQPPVHPPQSGHGSPGHSGQSQLFRTIGKAAPLCSPISHLLVLQPPETMHVPGYPLWPFQPLHTLPLQPGTDFPLPPFFCSFLFILKVSAQRLLSNRPPSQAGASTASGLPQLPVPPPSWPSHTQPVHTPPASSPALTTLGDLCLRSSRGTWDCSSFTPIHTCHTFDTPNSKSRTRLVLLPSLCSCGVPWLGCPSDLPGILPSPLTAPPPSDGMVLTADQWRKDARRAGWHSVPPSE